jgi:alkylation response protein AidB-like acyl-CoA dehydrogenase
LKAFIDSGLMAAAKDADVGGMQLPTVVEMAAMSFFFKASVALGGYPMLNARQCQHHPCARHPPASRGVCQAGLEGRTFGTMCLSEPQAGSSLSDIATKAVPDTGSEAHGAAPWQQDPLGPRFRLKGNKMWISGGEHEMGENIVHLVLAKIPAKTARPSPA